MRKLLFAWLALALLPAVAFAQGAGYTNLTGTFTPYPNGSVQGAWVNQSTTIQLPLLNGSVFPTTAASNFNSSGVFTMWLADNNIIQPLPSQWSITACQHGGQQPLCCTRQLTVTGTTQDMSIALATCPMGGGGGSGAVGITNYAASFTNVTTETILASASLFTIPNLIIQCKDTSGTKITPASINTSGTSNVVVTFAVPQSGTCVINGTSNNTGQQGSLYLPLVGGTMQGPINMAGFSLLDAVLPFQENVTTFGAKCDGVTDDTPAFTAAWLAATASYLATGAPVKIIYGGTCVVSTTSPAIGGSGAHWDGSGGVILVPVQSGFVFEAQSADDVSFDHIKINVIRNPGGATAQYSAIYWQSLAGDASDHYNFAVRDSTIVNSGWGVFVQNVAGTGTLHRVTIDNNTVYSPTIFTNGDGLHVEGNVQGTTISNNFVFNRADACIALVSNATQNSGPSVVDGNVCYNDAINLDDSGASNATWSNNQISSSGTTASGASSGLRIIQFPTDGSHAPWTPVNVKVIGNSFNPPSGTDANVKIDINGTVTSGTPADSNIDLTGNTFFPYTGNSNSALYIRANRVSVAGNTFVSGAELQTDYNSANAIPTQNVIVGANEWLGNGTIIIGPSLAYSLNIQVAHQNVLGTLTFTGSDYSVIPNNEAQTIYVPGCTFVNQSNGEACNVSPIVLPQQHTDQYFNTDCAANTALTGTAGQAPALSLAYGSLNADSFTLYEQAIIGSVSGYAVSPSYGLTFTCTTVHP